MTEAGSEQILTKIIDAIPMWVGIPFLILVAIVWVLWFLAPDWPTDAFRKKSKKR